MTSFSGDVIKKTEAIFGDETEKVLESLREPVRTYYVRCNTHKIHPDSLMSSLQKKGLEVAQNSAIPEAIGINVKGPYEIETPQNEIIVEKKTAESVLQGAHVYAPGIIKCGSMRIGDEVSITSELGEVVAVGKAVMSATEVLTFKKGLAIAVSSRRFQGPQIRELDEFSRGFLYPQSLVSMLTTCVLDPRPGETIVDMNCSPGGKLSHISQRMRNEGKIYGFDRNARKIQQTREIVTTLGCENVALAIHDSRYIPEDFPGLEADRVLIDPPCSALGLRPKAYDFTTQQRIDNLASYQKQFVKAASEIVRPGGTIVYSVCTFTLEECEEVVDFAVNACNLRVTNQTPFLGSVGSPEVPSGALCQRFHPHIHEIGYFIARFQR
jgi:16S rRNA (cytosine967-C5)-methyltransferase